jgi:hypothetical protein
MRALLIAAALGLAAAASAAPSAAPAAEPAVKDRATALAERVLEPWLDPAAQSAFVKAGFQAGLESSPDTLAVLAEHPGLKEELLSAIEAVVREGDRLGNGEFVGIVANVYRARLTPREVEALHTFYGTPTGRKMLAAAYGAVSPEAMAAGIAGDGKVSGRAIDEAMEDVKREAAASVTADDEAAFKALTGVLDQAKMDAVNLEVRKVSEAWANKPTPELDAKVDAAVTKVMARYGLGGEG